MQLMTREKAVLLGGAGVLILFAVIQFVVRPVMDRTSTLRRVVKDKRETLAQVQTKDLEYRKLQTEVTHLQSEIARQETGSKMLSAIEGIRKTCGLTENVLSMKPTTVPVGTEYQKTTVEVRLDGVTLAQLIDFLSQLDSLSLSGGIRSLDIRAAGRDLGVLNVIVQLAAVTTAESM